MKISKAHEDFQEDNKRFSNVSTKENSSKGNTNSQKT